MTTEESNKLIAEFMGFHEIMLDEHSKYDTDDVSNILEIDSLPKLDTINPEKLNFHTSWDWLMPVVEKIREKQMFSFISIYNQAMEEGCEIRVFDINNNNIFYTYPKVNTEEKTLLNVTHGAVVEFIKWYDQQKDSPDTM